MDSRSQRPSGANCPYLRIRLRFPESFRAPGASANPLRAQCGHYLVQCRPAAAGLRLVGSTRRGDRGDRVEIHRAVARQAFVQSCQLRRAIRDYAPSGGLDIGRPMGPGHCFGGMDGRDGQYRDATGAQRRYELDLCGILRRCIGDTRVVVGPAMGRADPSAQQRRAAAFRFLHDFRPDDDPQRSARPRHPCRIGLRHRLRLAIPFLPDQRSFMGAATRGSGGPAMGRDLASAEISMERRRNQ